MFSKYVTPVQPISDGAKEVTGINYIPDSNTMVHSGVVVTHYHLLNILLDFIDFLKAIGAKVILAAHNNKAFDSCELFNQLKVYTLDIFLQVHRWFCDTLPFF